MYRIELHKRIQQIILVFHFMGLWQNSGEYNFIILELGRKILQLVVLAYYPISLAIGAYKSTDEDETRFFAVSSIVVLNLTVRLYSILWKKEEILELNSQIGAYFIKNHEEFKQVNSKIKVFMKFSSSYLLMNLSSNVALIIFKLPIFTSEKELPMNFYFPFDWRQNEVVYWMVYTFISYEMLLSTTCTFLNVIIWYLMMSSATKYEILGSECRNVGLSSSGKGHSIQQELTELIKSHRNLQETTVKLKLCFGSLFFVQIITSGLGICGSIYALAFNSSEDPLIYGIYVVILVYNIFDIFMVMYFGNEIKLSSSRLSYCLFESNWMEQSKLYKKYVIIFMELLKKPQELVIGKIYPLNFETFTSIINFAYSMFNILKNFK